MPRGGDLRDRAAAILAASTTPLSSACLAESLLGMVSAPEAAASAVLRPMLDGDARIVYAAEEGWRARETGTDGGAKGAGEGVARRLGDCGRDESGATRLGAARARRTKAPDDVEDVEPDRWRPSGRRARRFLRVEGAETVDPLGPLVSERALAAALRTRPISPRARAPEADRLARRTDGEAAVSGSAPAERPWIAETWAVWEIDPALRAAAVVRLENGCLTREQAEVVPSPASRERALSPAALRRLAACAGGARWAHLAPRRTIVGLERALLAAGAVLPSDPPIGLARAGLALLGPPRPTSIEALAGRLGERIVEAEAPLERARAAASCLKRLLEIAAAREASGAAWGHDTDGGLATECSDPGPEAASAWAINPYHDRQDSDARLARLAVQLAGVPPTPGIYRFLDEEGTLLYVGKAIDLKRRVSSYFHRRAAPDRRTAAWIGRVARIEIEEAGSEPEALVREAETILRSGPKANTQRAVHDRRPPLAENLVLLLPSRKTGEIHVHLLRSGTPVARVSLGPRGGGTETLRGLLDRYYFGGARPETGPKGDAAANVATAVGTIDSGVGSAARGPRPPDPGPKTRGAARTGSPARRRRAALFSSWLARQRRPLSAFDPTDAASIDEAVRLALLHARSLRRGEKNVVYRG